MCSCGGGSGNGSSEESAVQEEQNLFFSDFPSGISKAEFDTLMIHQGNHAGSLDMSIVDGCYCTSDTVDDWSTRRNILNKKNVFADDRLVSIAAKSWTKCGIRVNKTYIDIGEVGYLYNRSDFARLQNEVAKQTEYIIKEGYKAIQPVAEYHLEKIVGGNWHDGAHSNIALFMKGSIVAFLQLESCRRDYADTEHEYGLVMEIRDLDIDTTSGGYLIFRNEYQIRSGKIFRRGWEGEEEI